MDPVGVLGMEEGGDIVFSNSHQSFVNPKLPPDPFYWVTPPPFGKKQSVKKGIPNMRI